MFLCSETRIKIWWNCMLPRYRLHWSPVAQYPPWAIRWHWRLLHPFCTRRERGVPKQGYPRHWKGKQQGDLFDSAVDSFYAGRVGKAGRFVFGTRISWSGHQHGLSVSAAYHAAQGSGILPYPSEVKVLLNELAHYPEMKFSVKMRLGWEYYDEWRQVLPLLNAVPLTRIILHPRIGRQQYKGMVYKKELRLFARCASIRWFITVICIHRMISGESKRSIPTWMEWW